jgi:hypothetical protein
MNIRNFTDLSQLSTLEERYAYLRLNGKVADATFDDMRWLNQRFYKSKAWRELRDEVIARDYGLDLGTPNVGVRGDPLIHHMNPITVDDILEGTENLLSTEYLITTSLMTHNAIHYGNESQLPRPFVERQPGDHLGWKRGSIDLDALRATDDAIRRGQTPGW